MFKISVITAVYNGANFIESAIMSVLNQNRSDIEMIIVDDASDDATGAICNGYVSKNIKYKKVARGGAGAARNIGIEMAQGEWIAFLDADDLYLEGAFNEEAICRLNNYNLDNYDIIYTPRFQSNMNLSENVKIDLPEPSDNIKNHLPNLEFWTCLYRRSFLNKNNVRFFTYQRQDVETAFRYLAFSATDSICVDPYFGFYLQRKNPASNTHSWDWYTVDLIKSKIYFDLFNNCIYGDDEIFLIETVINCVLDFYKRCFTNGKCDSENYDEMSQFLHDKLLMNDKMETLTKPLRRKLVTISFLSKIPYSFCSREKFVLSTALMSQRQTKRNDSASELIELNELLYRLKNISNKIRAGEISANE